MFCKNCGTDVTDMKYCPKCGTPITMIDNEKQREENTDENMSASSNNHLDKLSMPIERGSYEKVEKYNRWYGLGVAVCFSIALLSIIMVFMFGIWKKDRETTSNHTNENVTQKQTQQLTEETAKTSNQQSDVDYDWWVDKTYQAANSDGLYLWVEKLENDDMNYMWFLVGTIYHDDNTCHVAAKVSQKDISVSEEYIQYTAVDKDSKTVIQYYPKDNKIILVSKDINNGNYYNYSDTYFSVEEGVQTDKSFEEQEMETIDETDYYECFETKGGYDSTIAVRFNGTGQIDLDIVKIADGKLNLDSKDENLRIYKGYWEEVASYVSLTITENSSEIVLTVTGELERYSGTYIQLPDIGTGEVN